MGSFMALAPSRLQIVSGPCLEHSSMPGHIYGTVSVLMFLRSFCCIRTTLPRLHAVANRQIISDGYPGFPLDAEANADSANRQPIDTTDFAEGHGYSPLNEF